MSVVVSLTTIPPRFGHISTALHGLLQQTAKIDEIRLYVPRKYRRFPDYNGALPEVPKGVRLMQVDEDLGPASKVLFAADDLRGVDCDLIYCDDDRLYPPDQFAQMVADGQRQNGACIAVATRDIVGLDPTCHQRRLPRAVGYRKDLRYRLGRAMQIMSGGKQRPKRPLNNQAGYADIARGFGAVLVRPDFFDSAAYDIPKVLWSVDDIWLSGQMTRRGVPIWAMAGVYTPRETDGEAVTPLLTSVIDGVGRTDADQACVRYMQETYGIWR